MYLLTVVFTILIQVDSSKEIMHPYSLILSSGIFYSSQPINRFRPYPTSPTPNKITFSNKIIGFSLEEPSFVI
ncbi:hypothetical protein BCR41DRAFT_358744 [Lobosporangium transversale]|uniref:Uncharacterized protein n=1 Tax=Lobosporangium transversale TaxID=64571 RepID=A0A1Y2GF19_9FUNG|nr:hypothetical protein BCR41DRAFT_358744 [Lobosporangium transversale]ORZ09027.1 hypothetical protein BCR41DRAFT_358744 [Lobosporangium transversale]|eukprot:XP_021878654.1 hypothetical protein BCR41DRAFT_358744 [Lobosporangium transversale]